MKKNNEKIEFVVDCVQHSVLDSAGAGSGGSSSENDDCETYQGLLFTSRGNQSLHKISVYPIGSKTLQNATHTFFSLCLQKITKI